MRLVRDEDSLECCHMPRTLATLSLVHGLRPINKQKIQGRMQALFPDFIYLFARLIAIAQIIR